MTQALTFIGQLLSTLYNFVLPWGISFGVIIVTVVSMPLLVKLIKKFF